MVAAFERQYCIEGINGSTCFPVAIFSAFGIYIKRIRDKVIVSLISINKNLVSLVIFKMMI